MPMAAHTSPPPLRDGDRLTASEFILRWEAMPDLKHAELIDGIVYMASPVSYPHSRFHMALSGWLLKYEAGTPGCEGGSEGTWLMGGQNVPQPDNTLRILPHKGGQSTDDGDYTAGAPELIVEVAASSRARDLGIKRKLYESMKVQEYVVVATKPFQVIWHLWTPSGYRPLEPENDGLLRSRCFPGLWLDPAALLNADASRLLAVLDQGLATPEHAAFVVQLASSRRNL